MVEDESRPQTAQKDSRKVSGGFGVDEVEDLPPPKDRFDDSLQEDLNLDAHGRNNGIPSLDSASHPSLPPPNGDSSFLYSHSDHEPNSEGNVDMIDENDMQRHLNDVESSFLPAVSPVATSTREGIDDTYLFDKAQPSEAVNPSKGTATPQSENRVAGTDLGSPPTAPNAYPTPHPSSEENGNTTSALESMSSSPTAAAAARTVSRAISAAGTEENNQSSDTYEGSVEGFSEEEFGNEATPRKPRRHSDAASDRSTLRHHISNNNIVGDAGSTPGHTLLRQQSGSRPKFLKSRHGSQRSSISSFVTNPDSHDSSDLTLGADYALQSGGAVPAVHGFSRTNSMQLSRSISLGSMASGMEDYNGESTGRSVDGSLATLTEELQNKEWERPSPPQTPRATTTRSLAAPTDTIIARHVRNVQVPESVVKEYRNKTGTASPIRSGFAATTLGRSSKNLTLKEQSSTNERLSKENFDLKLKVMFLSDRLDKLSEEGVKEMISENVELKTGLAVMQRDNKALKRKIKDLEKQLKDEKDEDDRPSTARSETSNGAPSPQWFDHEGAQEREEELVYLRERVEEYITEIEKLRNDGLQRENDKRNLAEVVRSMGERRGQNFEAREEMDVWKDLLEQETSRREQGDEENKKLREEIFKLKTETASSTTVPGLNHTTNIYNITKKRSGSPTRPQSGLSSRISDDRNGAFSAGSTLVEEFKKEAEQLRHENAELRREVGAQTSMLTSRNREKERLYQEIEDLKLGIRRGAAGSVAGESIFERSASRAGPTHERSHSRASIGTRQTTITDAERDDYEAKHAELRDRVNSLKISNQDLQRELESCMEDFETAVEQKKQAESLAAELQEALEVAEGDLVVMQTDRDEALHGQEQAENMFEALKQEAQEELDAFAVEAEDANAEIDRLQGDLADTTENFNALQNEMRQMSEALVRLEDDQEHHLRRIQVLEKELDDANRELEQLEKNIVEANEKINRLTVQQESSQSEIAFLREEQDGDKIKIGDLEAAIKQAELSLQEEKGRTEELEQRLADERYQRDVVAGREKQEVQQVLNDLNREASTAKDEARKLRKNLSSREVEVAEWKQRLMELESNLREALGDINGTRSSLLHSIAKLQRELENTIREQDAAKASLSEKERLIKQRDSLLESHGLESRKLADMLDKERQSHRSTKHQFETFQKTQQHASRSLTQHEARVLELETSRQQDRRKLLTLENTYKDQLNDRNNLLLALWNRLSALCGPDWTHNNNLINGRALPTLEAISTMLPGFAKNLMSALKTIEALGSDFKTRVRNIEKDLWKEYQSLESNLDIRTKRLDRLETLTRSAIPSAGNSEGKREVDKLKDLNKAMKLEVSTLRAALDVRTGVYEEHSPAPSIPTGPRHKVNSERSKSRTSTITRHHSTSAVETLSARSGTSQGLERVGTSTGSIVDDDYRPDLKWQVRLQELEYKLKAEREARKLDRSSARQRLEEKSRENAELAAEVERERSRAKK